MKGRSRTERQGDVDEFDFFEDDRRLRDKLAEDDADRHRKDDPDGEKLVEPRETFQSRFACERGEREIRGGKVNLTVAEVIRSRLLP